MNRINQVGDTNANNGGSASAGPAGLQGDKGLDGDKGPDGNKGPDGDKGPDGNKGPDGDKGLDGDKGPAGPTGAAGPAGVGSPAICTLNLRSTLSHHDTMDTPQQDPLGFVTGFGQWVDNGFRVIGHWTPVILTSTTAAMFNYPDQKFLAPSAGHYLISANWVFKDTLSTNAQAVRVYVLKNQQIVQRDYIDNDGSDLPSSAPITKEWGRCITSIVELDQGDAITFATHPYGNGGNIKLVGYTTTDNNVYNKNPPGGTITTGSSSTVRHGTRVSFCKLHNPDSVVMAHCHLTLNSSVQYPNGKLSPFTAIIDQGSGYNATQQKYIAPKDGNYVVHISVSLGLPSTYPGDRVINLKIHKNGGTYSLTNHVIPAGVSSGASVHTIQTQAMVPLATGNDLEFHVTGVANTTGLNIDAAAVTIKQLEGTSMGKPHAYLAFNGGSPGAAWPNGKLTPWTAAIDDGNGYSAGITQRYIAPNDGTYEMHVLVNLKLAHSYTGTPSVRLKLLKNGSDYAVVTDRIPAGSNTYHVIKIHALVPLAVNDWVEVYATDNNNTTGLDVWGDGPWDVSALPYYFSTWMVNML